MNKTVSLDKLKAAFDSFLETKIVTLPVKHKYGIVAVALIIPLIAYYFLLFSPNSKKIKRLKKNKTKLEAEVRQIEATAAEFDKHKAELENTQVKFKHASLLLPQQKEIPSLLTNISSEGTNAGLDFISFTPKGESLKEFYAEIPIDIQVRGPYHNVGTFLDQVSKLPRIVSVSSLNMGGPNLVEGEMLLNTNVNLVTYRFLEPTDEK
ncbi:MAG: type 4a pilus biogenesis protein PilO [Desulfobulbaceae bacterium]|nr:type 4a pilus biogenesis protein PilO [Desulfobulbaceae bacterium]MCK5543858.1 type 4a pilus biogenesis protein PilO [Desulfobulbaceae bacterium]